MTIPAGPAFRACLLPIKPYVPGRTAEEAAGECPPARIIKLGSNENPLGPGRKAMEAVMKLAGSLSTYPDPTCVELRAAMAAATGMRVENFLVGNGSDEVLLLIAATYLNPGDNVVVSSHTFFNYEFVSRVFAGEVRTVATRDLHYDLAGMAAAVDSRTKLVFLCNPNNPTGLYFSHAELEGFLRSVPRTALIVMDEAYGEYADAEDFPRVPALLGEFPNLVAARTFSKAYGLAGLRVGYAMAAESVIKDLRQVKMPFNVNLPAQKAALAALDDQEHMQRTLRVTREGRAFLSGGLAKLGCRVLPTQGNFICFEPPRHAASICDHLFRQGVIVRPLARFGLEDWIRVTIGTPGMNGYFLEAFRGELGRVTPPIAAVVAPASGFR